MSKLLELQRGYGTAVDELEALAEAGGDAYEAKKLEVKSKGDTIARVREAEELKAAAAKPLGTGDGTKTFADVKGKELDKITMLSRSIIALAATKGIVTLARGWAKEHWGENEGGQVAKAMAVGSGSAGGYLVPEDQRMELIEMLRPASVVLSSNPRSIDMPNGNISIPRQVSGAQAEYVGENQNMVKTEPSFGAMMLRAKKLAALVPMSNDMLRYPSIAADAFVREDLTQALAQRADLALIRGVGSEYSPKGLLQFAIEAGVLQYLTANTTVNVVNVTNDLARAELALMNANVVMIRTGWLLSPRTYTYLSNLRDANDNLVFKEMAQGLLRGKPYKWTTQIPDNIGGTSTGSEVYLVEWSQYVHATATSMEIKVSDGATYHNGVELVSGLSQDQTVITALMAHDAGMRQPKALAVLTDVRWIP